MNQEIPFNDTDIIALDAVVRRIIELGATRAWIRWLDGELLAVAEADVDADEHSTMAQVRLAEVVVGAMITSDVDLEAMAAALVDVDRVFAPYRRRPLRFTPEPVIGDYASAGDAGPG